MKRIFCVPVLLVCFAIGGQADNPEKKLPDIHGVYHLVGDDGGKAYYGVCVINHEDGSDVVEAIHVSGSAVTHGVGIRKGNVISISWKQTVPASGAMGVTVYEMSKDLKTWDGVWALPGGKKGTERLKFLQTVKGKEDADT